MWQQWTSTRDLVIVSAASKRRRRMVVGVSLWICSLSEKREHQHVINIHSRWVWYLNYFLFNMCENAGGLPGRPSIPTAHYWERGGLWTHTHTQSLTLVSTSVHSSSSSWSSWPSKEKELYSSWSILCCDNDLEWHSREGMHPRVLYTWSVSWWVRHDSVSQYQWTALQLHLL